MSPILIFLIVFISLFAVICFLSFKYGMLHDASIQLDRPYSFARVQMAWWTLIVIASFVSIMIVKQDIPTLLQSTLILLGISAGTTVSARMIDTSDEQNKSIVRHQDIAESQNFLLDILSDENGVSIHRLQTVLFNVIFGVWFIAQVLNQLNNPSAGVNEVIPDITDRNLILLGMSSATYVGLKATENKTVPSTQPEQVPDENIHQQKAVG